MSAGAANNNDVGMFQQFFRWEASGSIVLLLATIVALIWANSPWADTYFALSNTYIGISWGEHVFKLSLSHWIGDGLMVIFFFVVGLEIKRELAIGQLASKDRAILPVSAALGGMLVPAALYAVLNVGGYGSAGWGIPMATDIAFALGILALFGSRAPTSLKVFLTALAIADDLGAVMVIALFYTDQVLLWALGVAGLGLFLIWLAGRQGIRSTPVYLILAVLVWAAVLASGVHATVAGVFIAMLVPVTAVIEPKEFLHRTRRRLDELEDAGMTRESMVDDHAQMDALDDMYLAVEDMRPPGISLEHNLHPIQAFLILPLFALFKAGIPLQGDTLAEFPTPISLGIILGLVVGKPVGIALFTWLAIKSGRARMPEGFSFGLLIGIGLLAGVGFTMSIFISELAFEDYGLISEAKLGVLVASLVAGIAGYLVLRKTLPAKT